MKKYLKLLLLVLLVATFSVKAEATYNVTINNGICGEDKVYNLYEVFYYDANEARYSLNVNWVDFFTTGAGKNFITVDANRYITNINNDADKEAVAKAAMEYLKAHKTTISPKYNSKDNGTCTSGKVQLNAIDSYYLLESPKGNVGTFVEVSGTAEITEKNLYPEVQSLLKTSGDATYAISTDLGKEFDVVIKIKLSRGVNDKLYIEDAPDTGFVIDTNTISVTGCEKTNYELSLTSLKQNKSVFGIKFKPEFLATVDDDDTIITITAKAKLTKDSNITQNSGGNVNTVYYYYTETESPPASTAIAYSWYFYIQTRYLVSEGVYKNLVGVNYNISSDAEGKNLLKFVKLEDGKYRLATSADDNSIVTADLVRTSKDSENITVTGLDAGKYYVIQTSVPYGFNKYTGDPYELEIKVTPNPTDKNLDYTTATAVIDVSQVGFSLPSTGSRGKLILTSIGALLVTISLSSIIIKSRKNN